jgi:hypothetical protein
LTLIYILNIVYFWLGKKFEGDSSKINELRAFFEEHSTKEAVASLDAAPIKKEYTEVSDVKVRC